VTLWFQDEARIGQKGRVCHRWWTRGLRPPGLCDQRYTWVHLFGAVRPVDGDRVALVMRVVSTQAMSVFLEGLASLLAPYEHAAMVLDRAGWHRANALRVPDNVTLVPLQSYSPELNPVERAWLYLRARHLSHRLLYDYDAIVEACSQAWNQLTPQRVTSLCNYPTIRRKSTSKAIRSCRRRWPTTPASAPPRQRTQAAQPSLSPAPVGVSEWAERHQGEGALELSSLF